MVTSSSSQQASCGLAQQGCSSFSHSMQLELVLPASHMKPDRAAHHSTNSPSQLVKPASRPLITWSSPRWPPEVQNALHGQHAAVTWSHACWHASRSRGGVMAELFEGQCPQGSSSDVHSFPDLHAGPCPLMERYLVDQRRLHCFWPGQALSRELQAQV